MLEQIVAALARHPGVSDWTVRRRHSRSVQLYLVGSDIENLRHVATEEFEVEVFNDHPAPKSHARRGKRGARAAGGDAGPGELDGRARGVATTKILAGDAARLDQRIDDAVAMARLVHNPPYPLPEPAGYPDLALADPELATPEASSRAAERFAQELWELVEREPGVRLSAAEVFLTRSDVSLRNSRGIEVASTGTRVLSEVVLLASEKGEEAEHFRQISARRFADLQLPREVPEAARFARDTLRARPPRTGVVPVVLAGEALVTLFEAFTFNASARAAFQKLTSISPGQNVLGERDTRGDRLTVRSNALRPFGLASYRFDEDGVAGQDVLLIEDGTLRNRIAGQRYAHYLGIPATGELGTTEVGPGSQPLASLLGGGAAYHVVGFSAPEVDPVTGDFGSEIRLAYALAPSGGQPIKGGSVSGNVFEAFADARFSSESEERQGYVGPQAVRFEALRVSGED